MPKVGNRVFGYSDEEKKRAFEYAQTTNEPIMEVNDFGNELKKKKKRGSAGMGSGGMGGGMYGGQM